MLIPTSGAKLAYWSRLLYGNKAKGEAFLSNLLFVDSWAKEAIDDGAMVIVIYDPHTPNGSELVAILEREGYGDRALTVLFMLQMNLSENSDWSSIVNDAGLMEVIFNNPNTRYIVLNSVDAMTAVANSSIALNVLTSNSTAWNMAVNIEKAVTALAGSALAVNFITDKAALYNVIYNNAQAMDIWFKVSVSRDIMINSATIMSVMTSSRSIMSALGKAQNAMSAIYDNADWRAAVIASTNAINGLTDVATSLSRNSSTLTGGKTFTVNDLKNYRIFVISVRYSFSSLNGSAGASATITADWQQGSPRSGQTSGSTTVRDVFDNIYLEPRGFCRNFVSALTCNKPVGTDSYVNTTFVRYILCE